ncbi:hypothetical protein WMF04_29190 [Sorangium sp. So ce260]|uniref:hypothetical protein n=1 Tax=Sorangium sp. So ce260 TaxID=3133291 RepID=UPI003F5FFAE0
MNARRFLASLALVPAAVALGCGSDDVLEEEATASTRQALRGPSFEMPQNGLDPKTVPVNFDLLTELKAQALSSSGFSAMLSRSPALAHRFNTGKGTSAEKVMEDIVSCALDSTQVVTAVTDERVFSWSGQFGLCGSTAPAWVGSWGDAPPTQHCLDFVSACVLARMNSLDRQVPISIHFESGDHQLSPKVRVQSTLRNKNAIKSFDRCPLDVAGPTDTCGWRPDFVGICERGARVTLQRSGASVVRVCKGIHGCEKNGQVPGYPGFQPYAGFVEQFASSEAIEFICPDDVGVGPSGRPGHTYFSLMVAPVPRGSLPPDPITAGSGDTFTYPAAEREVFTYREGAFYGDIFSGSSGDLGYVCHSDIWHAGKAYLADRLCADPGSSDCDALGVHAPCLDVCRGGLSAPPQEAYMKCEGGAHAWNAATVYLNEPHDISSDPAASAIVCTPHDECTLGAPLPDGCSPVVTSVCAVDPFCCNNTWDALCIDEVQSAANNLMCPIGSCGHALCTEGGALTSGCDVPPLASSGCVKLICDQDPYCCSTAWDATCISEVKSVCGKSCN